MKFQKTRSAQSVNGIFTITNYDDSKGNDTAIISVDETNSKKSINVWVSYLDLKDLSDMILKFLEDK